MATSIPRTLFGSQTQQGPEPTHPSSYSAQETGSSNQFVFLGAFDGSNSTDSGTSGIPTGKQTNGARKQFVQHPALAKPRRSRKVHFDSGNFRDLTGLSAIVGHVDQDAIDAATSAYQDFQKQAIAWLDANPSADPKTSIAVALTAFSRGAEAAAVFSRLLCEHGLTDPASGKVLVPPGQLGISAAVIDEPADTA